MLAQCCAKLYWSASCVMYVAGPYTSLRFLFSMRTTTSWSKLFVADILALPAGSADTPGFMLETTTERHRSRTRAKAVKAANARFGVTIPHFPGRAHHKEPRGCWYPSNQRVPIIGSDNTAAGGVQPSR